MSRTASVPNQYVEAGLINAQNTSETHTHRFENCAREITKLRKN